MEKAKDWKVFFGLMGLLDETFTKESSKLRTDIYFGSLADFDIEQIQKAVAVAIKTLKFYPKPAELLEIICGSVEDRAEIAWMAVVEHLDSGASVIFDDPIIPRVILHLWGSWPELCINLYADKIPFMAKDFKSSYRALARSREKFEPIKLVGFHEQHNGDRGFVEFIPKTLKINTGYKSLPAPEEIKLLEDSHD